MVLPGPSGALSSACVEDGRLEAASSAWGQKSPRLPMGAGPSPLPSVGVWTHLPWLCVLIRSGGCGYTGED